MRKLFILFSFIVWANTIVAQTDTTLSKQDKSLLDSMLNSDEFLSMFDDSARSYFDVSLGFGNGTFSTQNQAVNATGFTNQLVLTPALFYFFKSGFNLGVTGFLTNESGKLNLYQTGLTLGYGYDGNNISSGISYTKNFGDNKKYNGKSIYQNEVFAYFKYTKPFIQPGINLGFANGNFKQIDPFLYTPDTSVLIPNPRPILLQDSTNNKSNFFSISLTAEHNFEFENVFSKRDLLSINPVVMIIAARDYTATEHTTRFSGRLLNRFPKLRVYSKRRNETNTNKMQLQSIASSINITYGIGKFYVQPNVYFDYYLPETTGQRFSSIVGLTAGFTF